MRAATPAAVVAPWLILGTSTPPWEGIELATARVAEIWARRSFGHEVSLDPRIKIFSFDDATFSALGTADLPMADWAKVLGALDARSPRAILINKVFGDMPPGDDPRPLLETVSKLATPVAISAFVSQVPIKGRAALPLDRLRSRPTLAASDRRQTTAIPYGPAPALEGILAAPGLRIGHTNIEVGGAHFPAYEFGDGSTLSSLALSALGSALDGVPIDTWGRQHTRFVSPKDVAARTLSMRALIKHAQRGAPIDVIQPGDVVVVLPKMFSGNTEFMSTPFGSLPSAYYLVSIVNDVLAERFAKPLHGRAWIAAVALALGILLAATGAVRRIALRVALATTATIAIGIAAYVFGDWITPWLPASLGLLIGGGGVLLERQREAGIRQVRLDHEVETASILQRITIPPSDSAKCGVAVASTYLAASECAGDWWAQFEIGRLSYVIVADATGHGVSAAIIATAARSALETLCHFYRERGLDPPSPSVIIQKCNAVLWAMGNTQLTMCCCVAAIDAEGGEVTIANAGLHMPYLAPRALDDQRLLANPPGTRSDKDGILRIRSVGSPLGIGESVTSRPIKLPIKPGDRLVIFTDGIVEATDATGRQMPRYALPELLANLRGAEITTIRTALTAAHLAHRGDLELQDDVTLVVIELATAKAA